MAITYSSAGAGVSTETSAAALSPLCPASVGVGDILILQTAWEGTTSAPADPGGWTLLYGPQNVGEASVVARHWVYGKIADGSEDGATIALGAPAVTTMRAARIYSFIGRLAGSITDLVNGFTNLLGDNDPTGPTVVTTRAGGLACALVYQNDNNTLETFASASDTWTERGTVGGYIFALAPGGVLDLLTATPAANPGTVSGGAMTVANDPWGVIGFQIIDYVVVALNVFDTVTVTEDITVRVPLLRPSVFESVTITEDSPVTLTPLMMNVSDDITLAEDQTLLVHTPVDPVVIAVFDDVSVMDAVDVPPFSMESVTVTEDITLSLTASSQALLPVSDETVTVAESTTLSLAISPVSAEDVTLTESITLLMSAYLSSPFEDVTVIDSPTVSIPLLPVSVVETVLLDEAVSVLLDNLPIDTSETVSVVDEITVILGSGVVTTLSINVFDEITVLEAVEVRGVLRYRGVQMFRWEEVTA